MLTFHHQLRCKTGIGVTKRTIFIYVWPYVSDKESPKVVAFVKIVMVY